MSNISIDAALKLLPTGGKSPLSLDEARAPGFDQHLDRARAERTPTATNCPPPPPAPAARETTKRDSNQPTEKNGGSDDATARSHTNAAADEAPLEDAAPHEDDPIAADEVEISAAATAAAGATVTTPAEASDRKSASSASKSKLDSAAQAARHKSAAGVTAADAAPAATVKSATPAAAADTNVSLGAAEVAATPAPVAGVEENVAAASPHTSHAPKVAPAVELPGLHGATSAQSKPRPVAKEGEHIAADNTATRQAVAVEASHDARTTASAAAQSSTATAARPAVDRTSGSRRDTTDKKNSVAPEAASPVTQILVSAEPTTVGTSVVTADADVDSSQWTTSVKHEGPVHTAEITAPVEVPQDLPDPAARVSATSVGDSRPTHSGRLDALPTVGRHAAPNSGDQISLSDRVRLVQRVARAVHSAADRGGEVRLRLSPPELGSLRMEVVVQHGQMSAHIETETTAAKTALLDNLPALRSRLAEQDITVARFDVDVMDNPAEGNHQQYDQDGDWSRQATGSRTNPAARSLTEAAEPAKPTRAAAGSSSELNIVV